MTAARPGVLERRRLEQQALLDRAQVFACGLDPALGVRAVVVFGSVARGDFNLWSDVDVLVVADHLPDRWLDRMEAIGDAPAPVQPLAWTPVEWHRQHARRNAIAEEAVQLGRWLVGSAAGLGAIRGESRR